jgi:hypothetical protein
MTLEAHRYGIFNCVIVRLRARLNVVEFHFDTTELVAYAAAPVALDEQLLRIS